VRHGGCRRLQHARGDDGRGGGRDVQHLNTRRPALGGGSVVGLVRVHQVDDRRKRPQRAAARPTARAAPLCRRRLRREGGVRCDLHERRVGRREGHGGRQGEGQQAGAQLPAAMKRLRLTRVAHMHPVEEHLAAAVVVVVGVGVGRGGGGVMWCMRAVAHSTPTPSRPHEAVSRVGAHPQTRKLRWLCTRISVGVEGEVPEGHLGSS
jgi:hypothetical protein